MMVMKTMLPTTTSKAVSLATVMIMMMAARECQATQ